MVLPTGEGTALTCQSVFFKHGHNNISYHSGFFYNVTLMLISSRGGVYVPLPEPQNWENFCDYFGH